jgi:hypothetical protein
VRTRYIRKRKRYSFVWERYGADDPEADKERITPDVNADMQRLQDIVFDLFDTYGKDVALEMVEFATTGWGVGHQKRFRDEALVRDLLLMPGGPNRAALARTIADENKEKSSGSQDVEVIRQQINDALNTMRRYQEETGIFLTWGAQRDTNSAGSWA